MVLPGGIPFERNREDLGLREQGASVDTDLVRLVHKLQSGGGHPPAPPQREAPISHEEAAFVLSRLRASEEAEALLRRENSLLREDITRREEAFSAEREKLYSRIETVESSVAAAQALRSSSDEKNVRLKEILVETQREFGLVAGQAEVEKQRREALERQLLHLHDSSETATQSLADLAAAQQRADTLEDALHNVEATAAAEASAFARETAELKQKLSEAHGHTQDVLTELGVSVQHIEEERGVVEALRDQVDGLEAALDEARSAGEVAAQQLQESRASEAACQERLQHYMEHADAFEAERRTWAHLDEEMGHTEADLASSRALVAQLAEELREVTTLYKTRRETSPDALSLDCPSDFVSSVTSCTVYGTADSAESAHTATPSPPRSGPPPLEICPFMGVAFEDTSNIVARVKVGSAAFRAGIVRSTRIVSVDARQTSSASDVAAALSAHCVGDSVAVVCAVGGDGEGEEGGGGGERTAVSLTLGRQPMHKWSLGAALVV